MIATDQTPGGRLADRLAGRRLLVTGSTGLLAKVFVEKLLRSVPGIGAIYLLVRERADGTSSRERLQREVLGSSVFARLRASLGPRFEALCEEKVHLVGGDLTRERLGLGVDDYEALKGRIDIIVNSAAAVTFDERLDLALALNTEGPLRLLTLARDAGNLPFMQVSTCYVSGRQTGDIPEALNPPADGRTIDIDGAMDEMRRASTAILTASGSDDEQRRRRLIAAGMELAQRYGWNDTYTFTKWLGEQLVNRERGDVPLVILRPAIIESSFEEPLPGWIDGLRMADPMIIAYGRGKLAEFPADPAITIDIIPVDHVANAMVAALPTPGDGPGLRIFQVGSSARNPLRVAQLIRDLEEAYRRRPVVDESGHELRPGRFRPVRREEFFPKFEATLRRLTAWRRRLDRLGLFEPRRRRLAAQIAQIEQLIYFARIYTPYTHLDCRFLDGRLRELYEALDPADQREFSFAAETIDWSDYIINRHVPGLRRFVLGGSEGIASTASILRDSLRPGVSRVRAGLEDVESIFEAVARTARLCPDKTALQMYRGGSWVRYSFEEAVAATASIVRRLREYGLVPGDRVVICGENCPEWGLTYLAVVRAGLTAVPLDPQMPPADVLGCAAFAEAKLICAGRTTFDAIEAARAGRDGADAAAFAGPIVRLAESFVPPPGASRDAPPDAVEVQGDQLASILFTSGTTVAAKAVMLTHANFLSNVRSLLAAHGLDTSDSFVSVLPLYHAFEFTCGFLAPVLSGATVTYVEQPKGPEIIAAMQAGGVSMMLLVPRLLNLFHESIERRVAASGVLRRSLFRWFGRWSDWSGGRWGRVLFGRIHRQFGGRLRMFITGGSALDPDLYRAFRRMGFEVCEGYGLTETAPVLTWNPPGSGKVGSAGKALPGIELDIRDGNSEGVGELWARGPNVMRGYLKNPAATADVLSDGWFRSGDLVRRDADGFYYITGRVKDMIVTDAGKNVYPDEVENRYKELPYVKELCVVGLPSSAGAGETVHAVIVPDLDRARDMDPSTVERIIREAAAAIAEKIPTHQRIQTLHFWTSELPKTSTLKAKRGAIRDLLLAGEKSAATTHPASGAASSTAPSATLTPAQEFVCELLAQITKRPATAIRPDSHLMLDLGIDSLMKLQVIAEVEGNFDTTFPETAAASVTRVKDLFALIGNRQPVRGRVRGSSWRKRLHGAAAANGTALNGQHGPWIGDAALLPARWAARGGLGLFFRSYVRVRAEGIEHIPAAGPFIIAANHTSHLDAASIVTAIAGRRRMWIAGAEDYFFNTRVKSFVFGRLLDTIPFDRHSEGIEGLRRCVERLDQGDGLLYFPEGTRSLDGCLQPFKVGVAVMAVDGNAPVIPAYIDRAYELLRKGQRFVRPGVVSVRFGLPVESARYRSEDISEQHELYRELSRVIQTRVEALGGAAAAVRAEVRR